VPVLTAVQLRLEGDEMTLSASDRYRYAVRRLEWKAEQAAGVVEAPAPARRLLDVARSPARCGVLRGGLDGGSGGTGPIGFEGGRMRTVVRRLDGRLDRSDASHAPRR
jgi:DNA polymerase-3 subunit beta